MRYAIVGTGAIGGYFGGRLAKAGNEVHFLAHSDFKENYLKMFLFVSKSATNGKNSVVIN